jgi:hypothetical protein
MSIGRCSGELGKSNTGIAYVGTASDIGIE